ncbi:MAG: hypothetical protein HY421_02420, partial [Candidatus Kerfeldbacteria bacterium]|nr:hypothetical protein [Candidatus Kerfeldbacteria bacterium]
FAPAQETPSSALEPEPPASAVPPPVVIAPPSIQPTIPGKHGAAPDNLPV